MDPFIVTTCLAVGYGVGSTYIALKRRALLKAALSLSDTQRYTLGQRSARLAELIRINKNQESSIKDKNAIIENKNLEILALQRRLADAAHSAQASSLATKPTRKPKSN